MKIKMLASFQGEWSCAAGDEIERPDTEATRLIEAGYAEPVSADEAATEAASKLKAKG